MKEMVKLIFGGSAAFLVIAAMFCIAPVLLIWSVNSLAEAGGAKFYIEHNFWNWFCAFVFLVLVRGSESSDSK